jgi:glycosyltransferase involved in cell wall biosynthesis
MMVNPKGQIAFISVHGDPSVEIGKEEAGGQNIYVRQVGEALAQQGWQIDMFTRQTEPEQDRIIEHVPGCRTIHLAAGPASFVHRSELFEYLPEFVESFLQFQHQTETIYPLVHTHYWLSAWVGMQLRKHQPLKQVHTYHSLGAVKYSAVDDIPPIAQRRLEIEKACLETADCVVATSPQEKHDMRSLVSTNGTVEVIPCGTDLHHFGNMNRRQARQKLELDDSAAIVLYVGRFDRRKGIENLVRAMACSPMSSHPTAQLIIVGGSREGGKDSQERDRIVSIVDELELSDRVTLTGRVPHDLLPIYYAAADVCVVPSHYEPFGLVAIEAMASRTPVVASAVGGLQFTVLPEETGLLTPVKDNAAIAQAIHRIISDPDWQIQLGEAGRRRVEEYFSWQGVASQLEALYLKQLQQIWTNVTSPSIAS